MYFPMHMYAVGRVHALYGRVLLPRTSAQGQIGRCGETENTDSRGRNHKRIEKGPGLTTRHNRRTRYSPPTFRSTHGDVLSCACRPAKVAEDKLQKLVLRIRVQMHYVSGHGCDDDTQSVLSGSTA